MRAAPLSLSPRSESFVTHIIISGILSIGLTIGLISSVLLYFFVRDLKIIRQETAKHRYQEDDHLSSSPVTDVFTSRTQPLEKKDDNLFDHDESEEESSMTETEIPI